MRDAEASLIADGTSVDELMQRAGRGAAEWVWRLAGGRAVTVLCGPGNNGGDGWVIAEAIRTRGGEVAVIAAAEPATDAARTARALYRGQVVTDHQGEVLVDCLFGSGLTRPLGADHCALLSRLAASHRHIVAIDLPSGIDADLGLPLNRDLPRYDLTIALGAWKAAHFLMPAAATMGTLKLVDIGVAAVAGAAQAIARPHFAAPGADAHKYTRGLLGLVVGAMPGAALLAAQAAQGAGAGYVRLHADAPLAVPNELVVSTQPLADALSDKRLAALLIGPGLGRDGPAREKLTLALAEQVPAVLDADALVLLAPRLLAEHRAPLIATPHEGELLALERAWELDGAGSKVERATALALASDMVVVAKGADTVIAAPDGRLALAHRASSWLSTAGTGDVLAGTIASRLATAADPFDAACQGVWLHGEAARLAGQAFSAGQLAEKVRVAYAACL
ncbi:NAD(P)H-hydrate dehydratase [Novosphingobium sp.]|uniref:NAD(P)H-hydrate dehydratase n=1 Tax=Novosphingobium sp. TaxID=1874826 RepID=UPI0025EEB0DF|nr:NAD(P)H-hydrate dehydratase [Novosphingobium sp.]MCC6925394.1 NAD(P)H-hydrate dehydratase [Novosphingobium sp.]